MTDKVKAKKAFDLMQESHALLFDASNLVMSKELKELFNKASWAMWEITLIINKEIKEAE